jgi:sugar phosphate isomerase/epimerase
MSTRRQFIQQSGLLAAGLSSLNTSVFADSGAKKLSPFGVQLYTVRDLLPADPKGVMTKLAALGYRKFESFAGKDGFLWGMTPTDMKAFLKSIDVQMVSTHFDYRGQQDKPDELKKSIDMAREAGLTYLLCPYMGPQKSLDDFKKMADDFNRIGEMVGKAGLKFGYHNHDYSFRMLDGQLPQEVLLTRTDPKHVMFELDLCWIEFAGVDAVAHLKKYGKRYELCHVKDYNVVDGKAVQNDLGKGVVNYPKILRTALDNGMKHFLVEQEQYPQNPLTSLTNNAAYMKKLVV